MGKRKALNDCEYKTVLKPSLTVPFGNGVTWPVVGKIENKHIIHEINRELPKVIKERPPSKNKISKKKRRKSGTLLCNDVLYIGINSVTKALEKGPLQLVLVSNSAKPINMTSHLISLCAIRDTPACCVNGLSKTLSEILAVKSVLAVGFKEKKENPLQDLVDFIKDKAPPLIVPWVNIWKNDPALKKEIFTKEEVNEDCTTSAFTSTSMENKTENEIQKEVIKNGAANEMEVPSKTNASDEGNLSLEIKDDRLAPGCTTKLCELEKGKKRKLDTVDYSLYDTSFNFKEVTVPIKKKTKPS